MADRSNTMSRLAKRFVPLMALVGLQACGATLTGPPDGAFGLVTGYHAANFLLPQGYSVAALDGGRVRITAIGSSETPPARVERIALARAAEYGVEQGKKFFQATAPVHSVKCGKRDQIVNGQKAATRPTHYAVAEIEVTYANEPGDGKAQPTNDTAAALKAEIQNEVVSAEAQNQAATDVLAKCGG